MFAHCSPVVTLIHCQTHSSIHIAPSFYHPPNDFCFLMDATNNYWRIFRILCPKFKIVRSMIYTSHAVFTVNLNYCNLAVLNILTRLHKHCIALKKASIHHTIIATPDNKIRVDICWCHNGFLIHCQPPPFHRYSQSYSFHGAASQWYLQILHLPYWFR